MSVTNLYTSGTSNSNYIATGTIVYSNISTVPSKSKEETSEEWLRRRVQEICKVGDFMESE